MSYGRKYRQYVGPKSRAKTSSKGSPGPTKVHAMLIHIAIAKGYKPAWAGYKYREIFGVWPAGDPKPMPPNRWVKEKVTVLQAD